MNFRKLIASDYIAAADFGGKQPTLTIKSVQLVGLEDEKGKQQRRGVIHFKEAERGWILNRTNVEYLAAMFGQETDLWIGKRVTLLSVPVQFGAEKTEGIRIAGSPDLDKAVTFVLRLPRKKPKTVTLAVTKANGKAPATEPAADLPPLTDSERAAIEAEERAQS
jgi:hypothetical protein